MIAADTNIVVRLLVEDSPAQVASARHLLQTRGIYLLPGVIMETEWVLRSIFRWSRARVNQTLTDLLTVTNVTIETPEALRWALARHAEGADLADMLHLVAAKNLDGFITFDHALKQSAGSAPPVAIEVLG